MDGDQEAAGRQPGDAAREQTVICLSVFYFKENAIFFNKNKTFLSQQKIK